MSKKQEIFKPITVQAVEEAVAKLCDKNNECMLSEVSAELRRKKYTPNNADVNQVLKALAVMDKINYKDGKCSSKIATFLNPDVKKSAKIISYNTSSVGIKIEKEAVKNDWAVSFKNQTNTIIYFDGFYTRDKVRAAYAKLKSVNKDDTRSRRVL